MIIFPAIDIKDGKCVRLYQGDFASAHQVAFDPVETAMKFKSAGAKWIHMVDLDGSISGKHVNGDIFLSVAKQSGLLIQLGGGIRNMETASYYIENGISRIILGTAAIENETFLAEAVREFGDRVAVGIDAKDRIVRIRGWKTDAGVDFIELAKKIESFGVKTIIYTDISKDGTLAGISTKHYQELKAKVSCDLTASGGIKDINDITELLKLDIYGAICGKSLYSGSLDLKQAILECEKAKETNGYE